MSERVLEYLTFNGSFSAPPDAPFLVSNNAIMDVYPDHKTGEHTTIINRNTKGVFYVEYIKSNNTSELYGPYVYKKGINFGSWVNSIDYSNFLLNRLVDKLEFNSAGKFKDLPLRDLEEPTSYTTIVSDFYQVFEENS